MEKRDNIEIIPIEEEMQRSYLDYAMSVIISRALPDVRDGLKPVHRRIIYAMYETGNHYNKPRRKSMRVVGEVQGKYHPHGNDAIYVTIVRLAQDFSLRIPLVDGQGNFGSMDGDSAAAPRYTEARMSEAAHELVANIDDDTVNFKPNYDNTIEEPVVLPARFPNLLVNGTGGIAVGMATYIPTHNLGEVIDACCATIENPDITPEELMQYIPGPDFPTGGIIMGNSGVRTAFNTGRGSVVVRSKTSIINNNGKETIIVHEIPYQVNKAKLVEKIADLVKDKTIDGITDIRDESNKDGVRVVIELRRDAIGEVILNQLFKFTPMQTSFGYNMLALVKNKPARLSLREIIDNFLEFRREVITRKTKFNLNKSRERAHVLLGFALAISNIDRVIEIIRKADDRQEARENLMTEVFDAHDILPMLTLIDGIAQGGTDYKLSEIQANAILDLRLHRLTGLERDKISKDIDEVRAQINELLSILGSKQKIIEIVLDELQEVKRKFNTPRLTAIEQTFETFEDEDLIQREDMVITYTLEGYVKRVPLSTYRSQRRGGRGRSGMGVKDEDVVKDVIIANTHDEIMFFSSVGKVYKMKIYRLPVCSPTSKGRAIVNLLPVEDNEAVSTILVVKKDEDFRSFSKSSESDLMRGDTEHRTAAYSDVREDSSTVSTKQKTDYEELGKRSNEDKTLIFVTSFGNIRRNKFSDFVNIQANGKKAIGLDDGEKLIGVSFADADDDVFIATKCGICNRFSIQGVRIFAGRTSNGVRGIKLKKDDEVISMAILDRWDIDTIEERELYLKNADQLRKASNIPSDAIVKDRMTLLAQSEKFILTVTENGFGKVSSFYEYRSTSRGTQGFTNISITERNGKVVNSFTVSLDTHIMMITNAGRIMRCGVHDIRVTRRVAQGVILLRLDPGEIITSVSAIHETPDESTESDVMERKSDF
ncbi:MAG: DNA gyrase subunit A [Holosporales bacterium]|jgi:DNA gyrase subunit A|nr:DNA gyrase subunit A [Holosporales bacterium]